MAYIKRIGYRQIHAIKHQVIAALGMVFKAMRMFDFKEWAATSAPSLAPFIADCSSEGTLYARHGDNSAPLVQNYAMLLNSCTMSLEASAANGDPEMKEYWIESIKSSSASDHSEEDYYGSAHGGEWDVTGFIIRSGIVLTLGALEEFERGLLRILVVHGTKPRAISGRTELFRPRLKNFVHISPEWEKIEKSKKTYALPGRHSLLKEYSIDPTPSTEWNKRLSDIRKDRNQIAHGREALTFPLERFLLLHYDVYRAMRHLGNEAVKAQNIEL